MYIIMHICVYTNTSTYIYIYVRIYRYVHTYHIYHIYISYCTTIIKLHYFALVICIYIYVSMYVYVRYLYSCADTHTHTHECLDGKLASALQDLLRGHRSGVTCFYHVDKSVICCSM